jgi:hypothetical protein
MSNRTGPLDPRPILSTLWIFVALNVAFRDIHEFFRSGVIDAIAAGEVNGTRLDDGLILLGGIAVEIPLLMIVLSRITTRPLNRHLNRIAAPLTMLIIATGGIRDIDDIFFAAVEGIALAVIVWTVQTWGEPTRVDAHRTASPTTS